MMANPPELRWGLLATGSIAEVFARDLAQAKGNALVAVGSRSADSAKRFGAKFGLAVEACHGSYDALLADQRVDAVYISTPHPWHAEWTMRAMAAGKHVLCEKPLAMDHGEASEMIAAAKRHGVLLLEAFMYRCHPQTAKIVELIRAGAIGEVRSIEATFGFQAESNPHGRHFSPTLGGGGIMDVGCYTMSFARLIAGVARGHDFAEPIEVTGAAHIGETGVDEWAIASLKFPGNITAQLAAAVNLELGASAKIFGSEGSLHVPEPWTPARAGGRWELHLRKNGHAIPQTILGEAALPLYAIEAQAFSAGVAARAVAHPAMSPDDSLGNMGALDRWRAAIGLRDPAAASTR